MERTEVAATKQRGPRHVRRHAGRFRERLSFKTKLVSVVLGVVLAGGGAFAATNWVIGLEPDQAAKGSRRTSPT